MLCALPVDDPPLELEPRHSINLKWLIAHTTNRLVVLHQIRQRLLVIRPLLTTLKNDRSVGGVVADELRTDERHVVLSAQEFAEFVEESKAMMSVIRTPHRGLQPRDLVRIEVAELRRARGEKVVHNPRGN